jgi:rare lipoprotein A
MLNLFVRTGSSTHSHIKRTLKVAFSILFLSSFVLLNGCSTVQTKDGPPPYDVDASNIPDAVPKAERLSKYGNLSSYRVNGKYYYTMKSSKNYHEQGVASWYGTKFHRQRTSSGEPYNMLAMTAAHKTLPLPSYVQVTNLKNGRKVIVKVNDRGPFEANRLIDLSYVAAKKLGVVGHGTAFVDVKAIDPGEMNTTTFFAQNTKKPEISPSSRISPFLAQNSKKPEVSHSSFSSVYLQVGAFQNRQYAEKLKNRLSPMVSSPIHVTKLAHAAHHLYHVKIGPLKDVATANQLTARLKQIGISSKQTLA